MNNNPVTNWYELLNKFSREFLEQPEIALYKLPDTVIKSGWLGYPGATEEQLQAAEARLGRSLPPSYRAFLKTSNGFRHFGSFIHKMWSVDEIDWFQVRHQDWIDAYLNPASVGYNPELGKPRDDEQDMSGFRWGDLRYCLEISDVGDSAIMLLNPQMADETGEWEAVFFANWIPGTHTYEDFGEMARAHFTEFSRLAAEDQRIYGDRVLTQDGLSGLIALFHEQIDQYQKRARLSENNVLSGDVLGMEFMGVHEAGLVEGMTDVLAQVEALGHQLSDPTLLRDGLQQISRMVREEARRREAESQGHLLQNMQSLLGSMFISDGMNRISESMRTAGVWQGMYMGASLIESFLQKMHR
jgi:hypothetical protein